MNRGFKHKRRLIMKLMASTETDPGGKADDKVMEEYNRCKKLYVALCREHELNPFDLDILSVSVSGLPKTEKEKIVRSILKLIRLERCLGDKLAKGLFPLTVRESRRSGYLVPPQKSA